MTQNVFKMSIAAAVVGAGLFSIAATAAEATGFYKGKKVTLYIGFGAGGGYDTYARLAARHLGNHLPGQPNIVPVNMPGAGGMKAANYLYAVAPKDGTSLGVVSDAAALEQVLGTPGIEFDASKFNWIGRLTSSTTVYFTWHTSPSKTFDIIRERETIVASAGRGITAYLPRALNRLAGAKFKLVTGFSGSRESLLALERGEVEAGYGLWSQVKVRQAEWLRDNKINLIFVATARRISDLPKVPSVVELAPDEASKRILKTLVSTGEVGRAILTTPGVPGDRVVTLRAAFKAMLQDPAFLKDAKKSKLKIEPLRGEELQEVVTETVTLPSSLLPALRSAVR